MCNKQVDIMGNSLGGKKRAAKIMKINGEMIKLKTPVQAGSVTKDYPGYVLLESEAVKHFGIRAKPLEVYQELKPKKLYFLVELPKYPEERAPRKIRSGINMSAKDRLEGLMLAKRSVSDLSTMQPKSCIRLEESGGNGSDPVRLKMRVPKGEVEKLMRESQNEAEAAERIMQLCLGSATHNMDRVPQRPGLVVNRQVHWNEGGYGRANESLNAREVCIIVLDLNFENARRRNEHENKIKNVTLF